MLRPLSSARVNTRLTHHLLWYVTIRVQHMNQTDKFDPNSSGIQNSLLFCRWPALYPGPVSYQTACGEVSTDSSQSGVSRQQSVRCHQTAIGQAPSDSSISQVSTDSSRWGVSRQQSVRCQQTAVSQVSSDSSRSGISRQQSVRRQQIAVGLVSADSRQIPRQIDQKFIKITPSYLKKLKLRI